MTELGKLIADTSQHIDTIANYFDHLDREQRHEAVRHLKTREVAELYARALNAAPLTLEFFVPPDTPEGVPVIHHGKNSLPAFRNFKKPFLKVRGDATALCGFNDTWHTFVSGPGYFKCVVTPSELVDRGAVVIDYFQVPEDQGAMPAHWPKIKPNSRGLQFFIYHKMRDYMRRVSSHVSVGAAYKGDSTKEFGAYFILCRDDELGSIGGSRQLEPASSGSTR